MKLTTTAFADMAPIPGEFAFAVIDPAAHVKLSANRNPDFEWSDLPAGTRSLALLCHDPDVPSRGDDVNKEGRVVPASLPRVEGADGSAPLPRQDHPAALAAVRARDALDHHRLQRRRAHPG